MILGDGKSGFIFDEWRAMTRRWGTFNGWLVANLGRRTSSGRVLPELDGLRFISIMMVVIYHFNLKFQEIVGASEIDWVAQLADTGGFGVRIFFVISGFILALPFAAHYLKQGRKVRLGSYFWRRVTRLEPPYIISMTLILIAWIIFEHATLGELFPHYAVGLFYLHNLGYGTMNPVNGVAWTLEVEIQFYLLVPLLMTVFSIRSRPLRLFVIVAIALCSVALQTFFIDVDSIWSRTLVAHLQFFLLGLLLADIYLVSWNSNPKTHLFWDVLWLISWPLLLLVLEKKIAVDLVTPFLVLLLFLAAFRGPITRKALRQATIFTIGGMCYSIYLLHVQIIHVIAPFAAEISPGSSALQFVLQLALVTPLVILGSAIFFVLIERPCMVKDWPQRLWTHLAQARFNGVARIRRL